jgi:transposase-like protein
MKAMESWHSGCVGFDILHTDVVEVTEERRTYTIKTYNGYETRQGSSVYQCRHCGKKWVENINGPLILSEEVEKHIHDYYYEYTECKAE